MPRDAQTAIHLKDYTPPAYLIDRVELVFRLDPARTRVTSRIAFRPNPQATGRDFFLHGEGLTLIRARIDGAEITPRLVEGGLEADVPDAPFTWEAEVEIAPEGNTALEGLYMSNGMFCTQCEAEGFRKITYSPDRPDVMAEFHVRIESDLPVLLSNGNPAGQGPGWAEWHDPWPKPAYLFAVVAGDLRALSDRFTTRSGRVVDLNIWVRPGGDEAKRDFGMAALKASMRWDEEVYGREYDLDIFNIVAVDDFNMGAMENKGLNIFNTSCVLASAETSTDADFARIEAIIAHEYFHNWTGNRITCRDWFQLCLKEGLTVFRDRQFSGDMRGHAMQRIGDVQALRSRQFREDDGPLAHPVRPESFVEINNFYTATVYEKGAELIGMLKRLVGDAGYARALDLYFDRLDGQAATIEDWLAVFEEATGRDLGQFKRWYGQAGTPRLSVTEDWEDDASRPPSRDLDQDPGDEAPDQVRGGRYTLRFKQETPPTPGQPDKAPVVLPIAVGLLGPNGDEMRPTTILEMTEAEQSFVFDGLSTRPIPSILRGFSAPVILTGDRPASEKAFLLAHDTDPFRRWESARELAMDCLVAMVRDREAPDTAFLQALHGALRDADSDPAFRAHLLALPGDDQIASTLAERGTVPDPLAIHTARDRLAQAMAEEMAGTLDALYRTHQVTDPYAPTADQCANRALTNAALRLLMHVDADYTRAEAQYAAADNMTQRLGALAALLPHDQGTAELEDYQDRFAGDALAMNKWFAIQVAHANPQVAVTYADGLTQHPDFNMKNPNRFRAVFGALAGNHAGFHAADGRGYDLLADWLIRLDALNPQTAARMSTAFETWPRYDADRQARIRAALQRIAGTAGVSRDLAEMAGRLLKAG